MTISISEMKARADLRLIILGALLTSTTGAIAQIALVLRLTYATGSGVTVAALWLASTLPAVFLSPLIGRHLDRRETVAVLRGLALLQASFDLGLALLPGVAPVLLISVGLGLAAGTTAAGLYALVGALPRRQQSRSISNPLTLVQASEWTGATLGPLVGAWLVTVAGTRIPLGADSAGLLGAYFLLGRVTNRRLPNAVPAEMGHPLWAGVRLLTHDADLRRLVGPVALVIAAVNLGVVAEVFLATRALHAGSLGYGAMVGSWGGGLVLGTLLTPCLRRWNRLTVAGAGSIAAGTGLAAAGASPSLALAIAAYLLGGVGNGLEANSARLLVQDRARPAIQGRAFAAYFAFGRAAAAVGTVTAGLTLGPLGSRESMSLAAILAATGGVALLVIGRSPTGAPSKGDPVLSST